MGGCLGPSRDQTPICIDLVDQIYSEAERIATEDIPSMELYQIIRDKIAKKSLFRKLIDYLSAHRHSLNDTMQHTFRVMRQSKAFGSRLTSLIIIDQLTENLEKFTNVQSIQPRPKTAKRTNSRTQGEVPNRDIDVRFQTIYFQIILEIYDSEPRLREKVLHSLMEFAQKHDGKFTCDSLVLEVMERLVAQAKAKQDLDACAQAFSKIFQKSNEAIEDHQFSQETLRVFLSIWPDSHEDSLTKSCKQIIRTYIDRCMTSRQYGFIYLVIFQLYDSLYFSEDKIEELEDKILEIIQGDDLRDQFLKGMYKHLLTYLCICDIEEIRLRWELGLFDLPYESVKRMYPNITKKENKKNGFLALRRWINKNFINITDLVYYNRSTLVFCFIFNITAYIDDRDMLDWIIRVFFEVVRICDQSCLKMVFQILVDEIYRTREQSVEEGSLLIKIARKCVEEYDVTDNSTTEQYQNFIRQIELALPSRIKNEIIQLDCSIIAYSIPPFANGLLDALSCTVYSLRQSLKIPNESVKQKYFLTCSIMTMLRRIAEKGELQFLMAFFERLQEDQKQPLQPNVQRYMHRVLAYDILQLLTRQKSMPIEMQKLNLRIITTDSLFDEINSFLLSNPTWPTMPEQLQAKKQQPLRKLQQIRRMFERYSRQESKLSQPEIDVKITQYKRTSVVSDRSSGRGDESFHNVFGLIHDFRDGNKSTQKVSSNILTASIK